jgi:hypothetical protein
VGGRFIWPKDIGHAERFAEHRHKLAALVVMVAVLLAQEAGFDDQRALALRALLVSDVRQWNPLETASYAFCLHRFSFGFWKSLSLSAHWSMIMPFVGLGLRGIFAKSASSFLMVLGFT